MKSSFAEHAVLVHVEAEQPPQPLHARRAERRRAAVVAALDEAVGPAAVRARAARAHVLRAVDLDAAHVGVGAVHQPDEPALAQPLGRVELLGPAARVHAGVQPLVVVELVCVGDGRLARRRAAPAQRRDEPEHRARRLALLARELLEHRDEVGEAELVRALRAVAREDEVDVRAREALVEQRRVLHDLHQLERRHAVRRGRRRAERAVRLEHRAQLLARVVARAPARKLRTRSS